MAFERIAENKLREAVQLGEFDNLPGAGEPLDLDWYFELPPQLRMAFSILKSANCLPAEVELLSEIARLERNLSQAPVEHAAATRRALSDRRTQLAVALERARRA